MSDNSDQHNRGGMTAFLFSMAFVLIFFIYVSFFHQGVDLKENLQVAQKVRTDLAEAQVDITKIEEPWLPNSEMVKAGQKLFATNCAMCHGNEGKGDGAAGQALNPRPRNLVEGKWTKGGGYIGLFNVVTKGIPGTSMAPFGHLKLNERWALVQYMDSITQNKVKEDPKKISEFGKANK